MYLLSKKGDTISKYIYGSKDIFPSKEEMLITRMFGPVSFKYHNRKWPAEKFSPPENHLDANGEATLHYFGGYRYALTVRIPMIPPNPDIFIYTEVEIDDCSSWGILRNCEIKIDKNYQIDLKLAKNTTPCNFI